jgi:hypothetical protein
MNIRIKNCRNKRLKVLIEEAVAFYADKLMHRNLTRNITVTVKMKRMKDCYGMCHSTQHNKQGIPRNFVLTISPSGEDPIATLAHEMIHVKQFAKKELSPCLTFWKGKEVSEDTEYRKQPWEKEAYANDIGLYLRFLDASKNISTHPLKI